MTKHTRYNHSAKGRARNRSYWHRKGKALRIVRREQAARRAILDLAERRQT